MQEGPDSKFCNTCKTTKSVKLFEKRKHRKDGLCLKCKECRQKESNDYYIKNREKILNYHVGYFIQNTENIKKYKADYHQKNREKHLAKNAEIYKNNPEKYAQYHRDNWDRITAYRKGIHMNEPWVNVFRNAKTRAKQMKLPFNLTEEYVREIWPKDNKCPISGVEFVLGAKKVTPYSPSLDRTVPLDGYVKGNVAIIGYKVNSIKSNITDPNLFRRLADWLELRLKQKKENNGN
jgi:hypothetical protein